MSWETRLQPWQISADLSSSPVGLSGLDVSRIGTLQQIQNLPHLSNENKLNRKKISDKNFLTKLSSPPERGLFPVVFGQLTDLSWVLMSHIVILKIAWGFESLSKWSQTRIIQWLILRLLKSLKDNISSLYRHAQRFWSFVTHRGDSYR